MPLDLQSLPCFDVTTGRVLSLRPSHEKSVLWPVYCKLLKINWLDVYHGLLII